jgi:DNA-binding SARP family transcriptional activator/predicted ATPase
LRLLGDLQVTLDGSPFDDFTSKKSLALLSYLAVTARTHTREALSGLLWGESSTSQARASLRTVLWDLRRRLSSFIAADRQTISFVSGPSCWVDVLVLRETVEDVLHRSGGAPGRDDQRPLLTDDEVGDLEEAVSLYHGDFMAGFFVSDARHFEDWMLEERERARKAALEALHRLLVHYRRLRAYRSAIDIGNQLLAIAPWQEEIHRALMQLLALDGQRSAALVQYETCRQMLKEELGVDPTIETRLLYRRIEAGKPLEGEQMDSASSVNIDRRCPDLRFESDVFVGRDDEMIALGRMLGEPGGRLVTLVGPDGAGKTRLAWSVAQQIGPSFGQEAWVISLGADDPAGAPLTIGSRTAEDALESDPESQMARKIAKALDLPISARSSASKQLLDHLGQREALLVLDGFEPAEAEIDFILDILRRAPYLRLLVIADRPLEAESEQIIRLGGLDLPPRPEAGRRVWERPEEITIYTSVQLLVDRATQAAPSFELTPGNARHVIDLCRLTAGLPLALELVAACIGRVPLSQLVSGINHRLVTFNAERASAPSAGQVLTAVFFQVWDQLSSSERLALSKLAFFPDPFDDEAASDVAGIAPAALRGLVKKRLLLRRTSGRYGWHSALRRLALGRLHAVAFGHEAGEQPVDLEELQRRYRHHYLGVLARRAAGLRGPRAKTAAAEIRCDWCHVRRAWISAFAEADVTLLKDSVDGLSRFLLHEGWLREAVDLLERGVRAVTERNEAFQDDERLAVVIQLLIEKARFLNAQFLPERARRTAEFVCEMARTRDAKAPSSGVWAAAEAAALGEWGRALHGQGKLQAARERLQEALALTCDGPLGLRASILTYLGALERHREQPGRAREHLDQALTLYAELGDSWGRSQVLNELARIAENRSDLAAAEAYAEETLSLSQTMGCSHLQSAAHTTLGRVASGGEDFQAATDHCERALSIARDLGDPRAEAKALIELARIHLREGRREGAWRRSLLAVEQARVSGDPIIEARALLISGHAFTELGMTDQALRAYRMARQLQVMLGQSGQVIESLTGLARATLAQGDSDEALSFVEETLIRLEGGDLVGVSEPLRVYLACYQILEANDDPRARDVLGRASGLYEGMPASRRLDL